MPDLVGHTEEILHAVTNPLLPALGAVALARLRSARSFRLLLGLAALAAGAIESLTYATGNGVLGTLFAWAIAAAFWSEFILHVARPTFLQLFAVGDALLKAIARWRAGG